MTATASKEFNPMHQKRHSRLALYGATALCMSLLMIGCGPTITDIYLPDDDAGVDTCPDAGQDAGPDCGDGTGGSMTS